MGYLAKISLPTTALLTDFTERVAFLQTEYGARLQKRMRLFNTIATIGRYVWILGIVTMFLGIGIWNGLLLTAALFVAGKFFRWFFRNPTEKKYYKTLSAWTLETVKYFNTEINGQWYMFNAAQFFIYNEACCFLVDAEEGDCTGYSKNVIKKVTFEHVLLGSTSNTSGSISATTFGAFDSFAITNSWALGSSASYTSGSIRTKTRTTTHYEWRLDILTGFAQNPSLTLVFPDDDEKFVKDACGVLMP